jgi:hypothetical protein
MRFVIFYCALTLLGAGNAGTDDSLRLLDQIVNINSGTLNPAGVDDRAAAAKGTGFEAAGLAERGK